MGYEISTNIKDSQAKAVISTVQVESATWAATDPTMPITNEKLANVYLTSLVDKFKGKTALGTGLPSPYDTALIQYDKAYIKLNPYRLADK